MSAIKRALSVAGGAWPWLVAAGLVGAGVAGYSTFKITRAVYQRDALEAREQLAKFEAAVSQGAANTQAEARRLEAEANIREAARLDAIISTINSGWQQVLGQVRRDNQVLREAINAPEFDCLRVPYPADSLRLLSRPGGAVTAGDHLRSGTAASP